MLSVPEARQNLLNSLQILESEEIPIHQATGRVLRETVRAPFDLPPFSNSSMDGFAIRAEDIAHAGEQNP
ncbi:MAG: molybdopterin molybdenumtransferase MoeA, partial [Anaerolineae bacterium]|nr:molybdopterin molybdenumtransferase MoeA [Anaerolineae bacterium]